VGLRHPRRAALGFLGGEPVTFECNLDQGGFVPCSSPALYQGLGDGPHTFAGRPRDAVGNIGAPPSSTWRIDATAPETTISSAPKSGTATSATFAFSASEGGTFECGLDGAPFALCASPTSYSPLRPGDHRFEVRAGLSSLRLPDRRSRNRRSSSGGESLARSTTTSRSTGGE